MKKFAYSIVFATLLLSTGWAVIAQPTAVNKAKQAHIASPEHYSLLFENDEVVVLKMILKPSEQDNWHKHNAETVYFENGGKATISTSDGQMTLDIPDGHVMWHEKWERQVKNIGDTTITAIIVERK